MWNPIKFTVYNSNDAQISIIHPNGSVVINLYSCSLKDEIVCFVYI